MGYSGRSSPRRLGILTFLVIVGLTTVAVGQTSTFTGNAFRRSPVSQRTGYAIGLVSGLSVAKFQGPEATGILVECLKGMTYGQLLAIIEKYIADNPAEWHHHMNQIANDALVGACTKR